MKCAICGRAINKNHRYFRDLDDTEKYYHRTCLERQGYRQGPRANPERCRGRAKKVVADFRWSLQNEKNFRAQHWSVDFMLDMLQTHDFSHREYELITKELEKAGAFQNLPEHNPKHDWVTPIACPKCGNTNAKKLESRYGQKMLCMKCGTEFEWGANPRPSPKRPHCGNSKGHVDAGPGLLIRGGPLYKEVPVEMYSDRGSKSALFAHILESFKTGLKNAGRSADENYKHLTIVYMSRAMAYYDLLIFEEQVDFRKKFPGKYETMESWIYPR